MALINAGEELVAELLDIKLAVLTEYDLAYTEGKDIIETIGDAHAGEIETSRILNLYPDLVKGTGQCEFPNFPPGIIVRNKRKFWANGVWGDPTKATPEKGRRINELVVRKLIEFIKSFNNFSED